MKLLCLSDLHRDCKVTKVKQQPVIDGLLEEHQPDVVVIAGDAHESNSSLNAFKGLSEAFKGYKVIFTLGNHEFFEKTPKQVLKHYQRKYDPDKYDVHCLDLIGHYDLDHVRFLGNVLWYDGSMSTLPMQNLYNWQGWADRLIDSGNFKYMDENDKCRKQIEASIKSTPEHMTKVLVTHCVPHQELNGHMRKLRSPWNAYSGVADYLTYLAEHGMEVDYSICGHTHWRIVGRVIGNTRCVNVGSEYWEIKHFILEV